MFQSQFDALPSSERLQASILANEAELMRLNQKLEQHPHLASELEAQILAVRSRIDTETNQLETFDGMTFDNYIQMMLASGNVVHSVDRGLLSVVSDVTDIFGIVSAVGWVTGRNFITGERLTTAEQRAAGFNALINVASLAASMTGAGLAKKAGGSAVRYLAADIASTALGGVSGMATAGLLDYMNAPPWLQTLGGMGVGFGVGMGSNIALTDGLNVRNAGAVADNWRGVDNSDLNVRPRTGVRRIIDTNGLRNELPLTEQQIQELMNYAESLGMPRENIRIAGPNDTSPTGLIFDEILNINNDVLPATGDNLLINSRITGRGAIAHEVVGHFEAGLAGRSFEVWDSNFNINRINFALDEAQASIRAARFAPGLSEIERYQLIRDGLSRLRDADLRLRDVRELLHINRR